MKDTFSNMVGESALMREIFETIKRIADFKTTVLLQGESGTGKELIARAIHNSSRRKNAPFVPINCGAIPEHLIESELFGHKKGSFTDATRDKKGLFEEANGGTILLDEVGELPLHLQVKLLRVLQESEVRPVGEGQAIPIDVRIIAATLRDLEQDVIDGRFRDDLFYRLNVICIHIPPLRERKEDIPFLVRYLVKRNQERLGIQVSKVSDEALGHLVNYSWPGNIRELENCVERSMILTDGDTIEMSALPAVIFQKEERAWRFSSTEESLSIKFHSRIMEEELIRKALQRTKGNRTHAAKLLEISHRTLLYKLKEYGIDGDTREISDESDLEDSK